MEWISVKDKLPKHEQKVMCFSPKSLIINDEPAYGIFIFDENEEYGTQWNLEFIIGYDYEWEGTEREITHWMPLEPPKSYKP